MHDFLVALGLVLAIEGALYALFPGAMRRYMLMALEMPERSWRTGGLIAAVAGVVLVWLLRG
jgi:uncharacterized protein YjeT (DUF2065 family)